jgi:predicted DNA-binding transcriptional regulator AlpA
MISDVLDQATLVPAQGKLRPKRLQDGLAYPPRAMRVDRAAAYLSMSRSAFLDLVNAGTLPKPTRIGGLVLWDRLALDVAFEELAAEGEGDRPNSFDAVIEAIRK